MKKEEALKQSEQAIEELAESLKAGKSEALIRYLESVSRFHRYSFGNCMLIALQNPDATRVAGFGTWKKLGRTVKKGERGIGILAPMIRKRETEESIGNEDNSSKLLCGFRVVHVFDISQTEGNDLAEVPSLVGDPGANLSYLEAIVRNRQIELRYEDIPGGALGLSHGGRITIQSGLSDVDRFAVLAHELGHEMLHHAERRSETDKKVRETEAEAVAFVVCRSIGIDCASHASDYIQMYQGDENTLMRSLENVRSVSSGILVKLEQLRMAEIQHADSPSDLACALG